LAGILIVTTITTVFAVLFTKWLARRRGYRVPAAPTDDRAAESAGGFQ
jgi:hypothetical protein